MEVALISSSSIRIKSKQATFVINPQDKTLVYNAAVVFATDKKKLTLAADAVVIDGPGDYEIGGVKISGVRADDVVTYSFIVDDVNVVLTDSGTLAKSHAKMRDYDIVILDVDTDDDITGATNVANAAVLYMGEKADAAVEKYVKEGLTKANKFSTTKDKLPTEVQQILLS